MGSIRRPEVTLDQRWEAKGQVTLLTGIQALVHVPAVERRQGQQVEQRQEYVHDDEREEHVRRETRRADAG